MTEASVWTACLDLIRGTTPGLWPIIALSLRVTLSAVLLAALVGLPLGALIGISRFPGRDAVVVAINALMGLPPVVAGLLIYLALSRSGPFGRDKASATETPPLSPPQARVFTSFGGKRRTPRSKPIGKATLISRDSNTIGMMLSAATTCSPRLASTSNSRPISTNRMPFSASSTISQK